jgi:hypothetical protein
MAMSLTDPSCSSGEEFGAWAPVVHYKVDIPGDKSLWLNTNTKMFHLSHVEHVEDVSQVALRAIQLLSGLTPQNAGSVSG